MQHIVFYLAETFFSPFGKDLCHRLAHTAFDIPVEIVKDHAQILRECLANRGLTGTHIAYQDNSCHALALLDWLCLDDLHALVVGQFFCPLVHGLWQSVVLAFVTQVGTIAAVENLQFRIFQE